MDRNLTFHAFALIAHFGAVGSLSPLANLPDSLRSFAQLVSIE
jgi:hypothetical protein